MIIRSTTSRSQRSQHTRARTHSSTPHSLTYGIGCARRLVLRVVVGMLPQVSHPGILHRVWCTLRKVCLVLPSHQGGATAAAVEGEEGDSSANAEHHDAEVAKELEACQRRV